MDQTMRVMTAALIAVVMVLIPVTGWAAYETRRASTAEREVAQLCELTKSNNGLLKPVSKLLKDLASQNNAYAAVGLMQAAPDLARIIDLVIVLQTDPADPVAKKEAIRVHDAGVQRSRGGL